MLVLALEFSRGCTAHAGVGHHADRTRRTRELPPDRGTHGVSGPTAPGSVARGARGLDSDLRAGGHPWDVTGIDPTGSLPQNEIVRVRSTSQGPVREGRAPVAVQSTETEGGQSSAGVREPPSNQCSTG